MPYKSYDRLQVVNRISQQVVEELTFDRESSKGIIGICSDPTAGVFYVYDDYSVFQVCYSSCMYFHFF